MNLNLAACQHYIEPCQIAFNCKSSWLMVVMANHRRFQQDCPSRPFFPYIVTTHKRRHSQWQNICFFSQWRSKNSQLLLCINVFVCFLWKISIFSYSFPWNYLDKQIWIQRLSVEAILLFIMCFSIFY